MQIKEGYNKAPLHIRISGRSDSDSAEVWLVQEGLPTINGSEAYKETLSYATVEELRALKNEIDSALRKMLNL